MQQILDAYLENIKVENCTLRPEVTAAVFRTPGCRVRGTDYDELPGRGVSYSGTRTEGNIYKYRAQTGMKIVPIVDEPQTKKFGFDSGWQNLALELTDGEFAAYSFRGIDAGHTATLELICKEAALVTVMQDGVEKACITLSPGSDLRRVSAELTSAAASTLVVSVQGGRIDLHSIAVD
ncbi:hypothetical protein D3C81_1595360 [compost metagenome]